MTLEQERRRRRVKEVCQKHQKALTPRFYTGDKAMYNQKVKPIDFLVEDVKTKTIYCYTHKAASSTWMSLFARLENNTEFLEQATRTGAFYQ